MRTSGRCPVSCAQAGAAVPGPGGPRFGVFPHRGRAPSARATGSRRTGVRRHAPYAAGCPARPGTSRTGRPRCDGMTVIPSQRPSSRSCLPDRPVRARDRAGPVAGRPGPGDREHTLIRSHCFPPSLRPSAGCFIQRSWPFTCTEERQAAPDTCRKPADFRLPAAGDGTQPWLGDLRCPAADSSRRCRIATRRPDT
jgi:hypothetical protein